MTDDETDLTDELESADCLEDQLDILFDEDDEWSELSSTCLECHGTGRSMGNECEYCDGTGEEL